METILEFGLRAVAYLLLEIVFGTLFYWSGWPWVKLLTLGRYPRSGWRSGSRESVYVACAGGGFWALLLMPAFGQF
ncbi:hypothetical protein [Pseudomonas benzenivorans]|uniref:Uncharacterized protein n=1 Tax=Pseudomonas benzenivorans TaxID=556533 RepID=A0ABY5H7P1_9PSED|nr:hypothetical protein [Pseudomonas benzenivorans]UTW07811.1 hypothetical protein KDW96_00270 [Pseudomonas benzenivorans]